MTLAAPSPKLPRACFARHVICRGDGVFSIRISWRREHWRGAQPTATIGGDVVDWPKFTRPTHGRTRSADGAREISALRAIRNWKSQ